MTNPALKLPDTEPVRTVYVCGYPGSGKTTVVDLALRLLDLRPVVEHITPIPHVTHGALWHLGRHRGSWLYDSCTGPFGGTDTLAMNINPKAVAFVRSLTHPSTQGDPRPAVILAEGDRLANNAFLNACPNLTLIHLALDPLDARTRTVNRAQDHGLQPQTLTWFKDRVTRIDNLTNSRPTLTLDATRPPHELATELATHLATHPVHTP